MMAEGGDAAMVEPDGVAREDYAACCCAVHNLCLSLHAEGIGTKWYIHIHTACRCTPRASAQSGAFTA